MNSVPTFIGVLVASLAGSVHCVGMCGGLLLSATGTRASDQILYHSARGLAYISLGGLLGWMGQGLWVQSGAEAVFEPIQLVGSVVLGVSLIVLALRMLIHQKPPQALAWTWMERPFRWALQGAHPRLRPLLVGFLTVFLPCGWLFGFLMMALASGTWSTGVVLMAAFWMGTVPLLAGVQWATQAGLRWLQKIPGISQARLQRGVAVGMLLMGLWSVVGHLRPYWIAQNTATPAVLNCHPKTSF